MQSVEIDGISVTVRIIDISDQGKLVLEKENGETIELQDLPRP